MNKDDLISKVASSIGISKSEAAKSVDAVFSSITNSLKGGNEVRLVGFGTFLITNRVSLYKKPPHLLFRLLSPCPFAFLFVKQLFNYLSIAFNFIATNFVNYICIQPHKIFLKR